MPAVRTAPRRGRGDPLTAPCGRSANGLALYRCRECSLTLLTRQPLTMLGVAVASTLVLVVGHSARCVWSGKVVIGQNDATVMAVSFRVVAVILIGKDGVAPGPRREPARRVLGVSTIQHRFRRGRTSPSVVLAGGIESRA